jgi:hypothetical protein
LIGLVSSFYLVVFSILITLDLPMDPGYSEVLPTNYIGLVSMLLILVECPCVATDV